MIWQTIKTGLFSNANVQKKMNLYQKLKIQLPHTEEKSLIATTAFAGLLYSVAFSDLHISIEERGKIEVELKKWSNLRAEEIDLISQMSDEDMREFSNFSSHDYSDYLGNNLSIDERYQILLSLFSLAATSEGVSVIETEEIRILCKGLLLEHKHFIAAQATVREHLNSLK